MSKYTQEEIENITNNVSLLDYFLHLENQGKVKFESKKGRDYFFKTEDDKYSVNDKGFFSFNSNEGGKILKAVMTLEKMSWKESLDFLSKFSNHYKNETIAERKKEFKAKENNSYSEIKIQYSGVPNNEKLLDYFQDRGISKEILQTHTRQIHYENNGRKYFGIGLENHSGGFEIRNPLAKIKIGKTDISEIKGTKNEMIVFEGMTDMLSFLQLQKLSRNQNSRTLVSLNSITNVERFILIHKDFSGKLFLCLDGDKGGDLATRKLLQEFSGKNVKDIRPLYSISEHENNDLNDYLKVKLDIQEKAIINQQKSSENENNTSQSRTISETKKVGSIAPERNSGETIEKSQSEPKTDNNAGQEMGSNHVGNGPAEAERNDQGRGEQGREPINRTQQNDAEQEHSLGRGLLDNSTDIPELDTLILKYKEQKLTNEQVAEVISVACFVSDDSRIRLNENLTITDDLKNIANQYKSGGIAKEGRGILDEYYTDNKIVSVIRNIIKDNFKDSKSLNVLEPSIGTGNFVYAVKELDAKSFVTGFEINETTAKIAKIFHPEAEINLRSFESEFIHENGVKKNSDDYKNQYDLVIGNPPYGEHRGLYKGLGEEPKISKYEDYFVKRSLDVMKEGGTLAMVLPSAWLNRQKKLDNAEISKAYRLPAGAFSGTKIGTDIIILKKAEQKISNNISDYFIRNPENVLGEIKEKTNKWGRSEKYVHGNLDEALAIFEQLESKKGSERIGDLFDGLWNTNDEIGIAEKHTVEIAETKKSIDLESEDEITFDDTQDKIEQVLSKLEEIKFKSPAVQKEIAKYSKLHIQITNKSEKLDQKDLIEIHQKADKILQSQNERNQEYKIQTKPELKKGILKYQFSKRDEIVDSSIQNSSNILEKEVRAFRDTEYDGTLNNRGEHYEYANFINGKWMHDFYYAEGNIYAKLKQLEIDFADKNSVGGTAGQYEKQKALLEKVLPKAKSLDEIIISPNHEFVHQFDLGKVEKETYNYNTKRHERTIVDYNLAEKFKDFVGTLPYDAFQGSSSWEVKGFVDNDTVTGSDKERNALIRERRKTAANDLFSKFLREELPEDLRVRFVKEFNENYNNIHVPDYSKFPLFSKIHQNFKGEELKLTEVQKAGIGRQTTKGVGLLAHEVGFGKTLSGILSMHEAMERGNAKRPLITVPNESILKQWIETIFETIPNAKVNVLGNLGKDYDLSKFDNKDGEITLVTYEGFNNIGFSNEITEDLASKFNYISANELKSVTNTERETQLELQKEKEIEGKMKYGKIYDWVDFGFDHMTFDEVHNANHIVGKVKIEDRRFASDFRNQNQQTSKLGINTWMAAQYIQDKHDGRNITLLSATPFTNKPLEYYSVLSLIANKRLEEKGYFNVNNFFETFMEADNDMEIDAKGDVKFKANVRRFKNNTLFQQLLSEFIDIKGEEDNLELVRPNKINKEYKVEQNDFTQQQYDLLNESFIASEKGAILTHILNARLIAISPYLSPFYDGEEPSLKEFVENSPKLNETMKLIAQNKKDIPESGQIIYSELAVDQFPKLKEYLIKEIGFRSDEVGIITGKTTKPHRISIQDDFNSGKIKVIIGSEAIQEGMNLQEKTTDTYFLSLPYNFTSLRQVEGRSWRQGNENKNVRMNFMLTNDSIDVFMLQKLQAKQARYMEAMKKGADVLDISDINTQELKTSIITNPETRANIEIELLKKKIEAEKGKLLADSAFVMRKFQDFLVIKDKIQTAENTYNKIVGYANDKDGNHEYWESKLPDYQKNIDRARAEVDKEIQNFAEKGVNVAEIEKQTKLTEDKILELDARLENLPEARAELVELYRLEKEELQRKNQDIDVLKERADENIELFTKSDKTNGIICLEEEKYEYQGRRR